jgi:hypothetical protein
LYRQFVRVPAFAVVFGALGVTSLATPYAPPPSEPGRHAVTVVDSRRVFPPGAAPEGVALQSASNNLDAVRHDGRVYLAFRTAPTHFASPDAVVYVVSSDDEIHWRREARFAVGRDLREPRFLSLGDRLMLYMTELGTSALSFEPGEVVAAELAGGRWSEPESIGLPDHVVWRVRVIDGTPVMAAYSGGEHLYKFDGLPMQVRLLRTDDGRHWTPLDPDRPVLYEGGGSEADFVATSDGYVGVIRDEAGDATGWGSKVCHGRDLANVTCTTDVRKYDSPHLFTHDGETYLLARRNVTEDGAYDLGVGSGVLRSIHNQLRYIWTGKRCALWRWVSGEDRFAFVIDLPSRGDTCFASAMHGARDDEWIVYDYSSRVDGPDTVWNAAQREPTHLYRHVLRFAQRK